MTKSTEEIVEEVTEEIVGETPEEVAPDAAESVWNRIPSLSDDKMTAEAATIIGEGKRACFIRFVSKNGKVLGQPIFVDGFFPRKFKGEMALR